MRKIKVLWGVIFILVLLQVLTLFYFVTDTKTDTTKDTKEEVVVEQSDFSSLGNQGIAAEVGSDQITAEEFVNRLIKDYGRNVLDDMINRELIFTEAKRLNVTISEEEINREISHLRKDYATEEEFKQAIREQVGISFEELRDEIRFYLLTEEMATKDIVISEEDMRTYYEENMDAFYQPSRYHLHRILVATKDEALDIIEEIDQGSSFEAVASERSIDMITAADGGDMGIVTSDALFLAYEILEVAEEIPINQISRPIETEEGFSIIKVTERMEGGQNSFEEVKDQIRREMALREVDGVSNFLDQLRENAGIKNYMFDE